MIWSPNGDIYFKVSSTVSLIRLLTSFSQVENATASHVDRPRHLDILRADMILLAVVPHAVVNYDVGERLAHFRRRTIRDWHIDHDRN